MKSIILIAMAILAIAGIYKLIPGMYLTRGNMAYAEGDTKKALEFYKKAIKFSPNAENKNSYALMLMRLGEFLEAEKLLNEVILYEGKAVNKTNAKLFRCMIYQKTDRLDEALLDAEEIFETFKNTTVYGVLGYLRQLKGGAELDFCLEAYDYNSDDRDICDNLTLAYIRSGELEKAKELAEQMRKKFPTFTEAFYRSAVIAKMMGDKESAKEFLDEIENCTRNALTTVLEEEINNLRSELENA